MNTNTTGSELDPLQRVFVPVEKGLSNGDKIFQTNDRQRYVRDAESGTFRRATPKIRGKAARRADKLARARAKEQV